MKYSRKCLVCDKEVISSNMRTFVHPECKNRTTPPVQAKTAEEIANDIHTMLAKTTLSSDVYQPISLKLIELKESLRTPSAKSVEVEEVSEPKGIDIIISAKDIGMGIDLIDSKFVITLGGDKLYTKQEFDEQQQKQAETISRLSGDMEWIAKFCNDPECKRLAKEALSLHK